VTLRGPLLPGQDSYRFFLSPAKIKEVLIDEAPDVIELGSYYTEPWAAFSYRRRRQAVGKACTLGAYFHTDVANAYVAEPLRAAAHSWLQDVSEALASGVEKIADVAAAGAEKYMRYVFQHCDVAMAASATQAQRLQQYGVDKVEIVPMGVDLNLFNPRRRSPALRAELGAKPETAVLMFAGRLCAEKRVLTVVEAFERLPSSFSSQLWIMGDGPQRDDVAAAAARNPGIKLLPYEGERARFAQMLASADVYASAGPFETFALAAIEAQACGLPLVGVDAGALRERAAPGLGFLGPVDDAEAMAANVVAAFAARAAIRSRARAHVERHFSWKRAFQRLLECYGSDALGPELAQHRRTPNAATRRESSPA
jgi:alpha-1,6-mannosyltransferase